MNYITKKCLLLGMISTLTATSLTGCGNSLKFGDSKLKYEEENNIEGTIPYKDLKNIRIVTLECEGIITTQLIIADESYYFKGYYTEYILIENGK